MSGSTGWGARQRYRPDPGVEMASDDTLYDVVAWRQAMQTLSSRAKGAFGELITTHKKPIVQFANKYEIDPSNLPYVEIFSATGGTTDNLTNRYRCQTGTNVGGYGVIRSKDTVNYLAGQGLECQITAAFTTGVANSLQFAGMFTVTDTLAMGYDGSAFSSIYSSGGVAEIQVITITATGSGTCNITLDNDSVGITVTNSTVQTNAEEIRAGLVADGTIGGKWRIEQEDNKVLCISRSVGDKTGTMSISGGVTASIAERIAGVAKTDNHTPQASWNVTTSPFTGFDPTKMNIYKIQFGYLGVANINFHIYDPNVGDWVLVHRQKVANVGTATNVRSPNMKAGWTSASLGSTTNLTVLGGSASLNLEGEENFINDVHNEVNTKASISTTLTNVLTIKNGLILGNKYNLTRLFPLRISVDNDHTKAVVVEVLKNATLAGTTNYQYHDEYASAVLYDTAGTTVTGGERIDGFTVGKGLSEDIDLSTLKAEVLPGELLTIAVRTVSGTATNTTVSLTWQEEK